jgi:UDP-N-acetylmuramoyl-L-alanyl-D-glutamate--2,6-diaminopimelate ligase
MLVPIFRSLKKLYHIFQAQYYSRVNNYPQKNLKFIGVTGSSGKSTTSAMIFHLLKNADFKVGLISTTGAFAGEEKIQTGLHVTTPDSKELYYLLTKMINAGVEYVILETSSHSLAQGRFGNIKFDHAVFTNIKRDHLDWHKTWENYAHAKASLIDKLSPGGYVFLNADDVESFEFLSKYLKREDLKNKKLKVHTYSFSKEVDLMNENFEGINFRYSGETFKIPILGAYNIQNILAALKLGESLGIKIKKSSEIFATFSGVEGRMQIVQKEPFGVIIDFAHNADSLEKSLESARRLLKKNGRLITVFGSAGLRDREKRFKMGEISGRLADVTIITAEDPRTETLASINSEIIRGAESSGALLQNRFFNSTEYTSLVENMSETALGAIKKSIFAFDEESVNSRYDAINFAIRIAQPGDIVITQGKGHEQSLCFGKTEYPFSDQDAIGRALNY